MKTFRFFLTRIFLRKPVLVVIVLALVFATNYITFTVARTIASTYEGIEEVGHFNIPRTYIANLDPDSTVDFDKISAKSIQEVYDRIEEEFTFGLFTDGYIADVRNKQNVEVTVAYMNQKYSELNGFKITAGSGYNFDYRVDSNKIPVLVGKGLADDYPLHSQFSVLDPALNKKVNYVVTGILEQDQSHSNLYALDSKQYYNFSVVVPLTESFIRDAEMSFKINGLMDLILTDTSRTRVRSLGDYIEKTIALKFNFFSQQENTDFYRDYFQSSMIFLSVVSVILLIAIILLAVWSSLAGVRIMLREFTINILVGLSYRRFRHLLVAYYLLLTLFALSAMFALATYSRQASWASKDASFMTYGFVAGLMPMDWIALLAAAVVNLLLIAVVTQTIVWRIKRVPISVGVLQ